MSGAEVPAEIQADECLSCGEEMPRNECPEARRTCGHHCNCSWIHDHCHWCDREWGEDDVPA